MNIIKIGFMVLLAILMLAGVASAEPPLLVV